MKITVTYETNLDMAHLALMVGHIKKKVDNINNERIVFGSNSAAKIEFKLDSASSSFEYNNVSRCDVDALVPAIIKHDGATRIVIDI